MENLLVPGREILLECGPDSDDEPLLRIEQRIVNIMSLSDGLEDEHSLDQLGRELDDLERQIRSAVPKSPAGIAVKIRHLWSSARSDNGGEELENLQTIHEALKLLEKLDDFAALPEPANGRHFAN